MSEKISSLLDGELSAEELVAASKGMDSDDLKTVERYQLIGALLRNECSSASIHVCRGDLSARIAHSIAAEPAWMLPVAERQPAPRKAPRREGVFFGGFAAAAALAAVAVMTVTPAWLDTPGEVEAPTASVDALDKEALNALLVEHGEFTGSAGLNGLVSYAKFVSQGSE